MSVFAPSTARYFDLIHNTLKLTPQELAKLEQNGFVVTDRLTFPQFKRGYAYIYWKDLPVLVTTDSLLHAIHQTYDQLFQQVESDLIRPKLIAFLENVRNAVQEAAQRNRSERLAPLYADLEVYLSVPLGVLNGKERDSQPERVRRYSDPISWVNNSNYLRRQGDVEELLQDSSDDHLELLGLKGFRPVGIEEVDLFGLKRDVDFTLLKARGHYVDDWYLMKYFGAMMWLALIDFQFVSYDELGQPTLNVEQIAAAHLLYEAIQASGQRQVWEEIDRLLTAFVGWSDNVTLNGLEQFMADCGAKTADAYFEMQPESLLVRLLEHDYGQQRIAAQGLQGGLATETPLPAPVSFMLMGQRFTLESLIMDQVVFDRLIVNGEKVLRAYPNPLDVLYALGNNRALTHLEGELKQYGYRAVLDSLREHASTYSHEFWESSFYTRWLRMILTLNESQPAGNCATAMRSEAWADKMLHTQLGSWAQLRRDNILYVKPPRELYAICEYPTGYVEPYPAFYAAMGEYARFGKATFANLTLEFDKEATRDLYRQTLDYFEQLEEVAVTLERLARKELNNEPFTTEEQLFVKSVVVRKYVGVEGYGGYVEESWDGWYNDLLPFGDNNPCVVADLHTNMDGNLGPAGVLHVGTGEPAALLMVVDQPEGQTLYVGPAFTYYEHLQEEMPPHRLTDEEWSHLISRRYERYREERQAKLAELDAPDIDDKFRERQSKSLAETIEDLEQYIAEDAHTKRPKRPDWTGSFRLPHDGLSVSLDLIKSKPRDYPRNGKPAEPESE